jgi:hypothetical protein
MMALKLASRVRASKFSGATTLLVAAAAIQAAFHVDAACAEDSIAQQRARLEKMTPEEKEEVRKKRVRFENMNPEQQQKMRELHETISSDPNAAALAETMKRYNRWFGTLDSAQRVEVLDIANPKLRVAKVKELIQQQEERRFREFVREHAVNLSTQDKDAFYKWFGDFVVRHEREIRSQMPRDVRERMDRMDERSKRGELMRSWSIHHSRHDADTPVPTAEDIDQLLESLSAEARKPFASPDQRQAHVIEFMRAAALSRSIPQVSREDLLKFYDSMKSDDPRRERLEGREGDDLIGDLRRMWVMDRWRERGGPPPGQRPFPPGGGRGPDGARPDGTRSDGPPPGKKDAPNDAP